MTRRDGEAMKPRIIRGIKKKNYPPDGYVMTMHDLEMDSMVFPKLIEWFKRLFA